jgi:acyl CoA:acetate/3-ketoacid CoA transferase beta subunit
LRSFRRQTSALVSNSASDIPATPQAKHVEKPASNSVKELHTALVSLGLDPPVLSASKRPDGTYRGRVELELPTGLQVFSPAQMHNEEDAALAAAADQALRALRAQLSM